MINTVYNTPLDTEIDFRFYLLESCCYFKVENTISIMEKMFGSSFFKSATLILKDCDHELLPKVELIRIKELAFKHDLKIFEWHFQSNIFDLLQ